MRTIRNSFLVVALGVALASTAYAQPKKDQAPAQPAGDEGIEIDEAKPDEGTIDMEAPEETPPSDLSSDLAAADQVTVFAAASRCFIATSFAASLSDFARAAAMSRASTRSSAPPTACST